MKAITIQDTNRSSTKRTIATSILGTAAASVAGFAVREIVRVRGNAHGSSTAMWPRSIERIVGGTRGWETPINQRPHLFFNKGNVAQMLECSTELHADSPAAAVALMDFVAQQQGEYQHYARSRLTTLLQTSFAHPAAIRSNRAAMSESQQSEEGRLTNLLSSCELTSLSFIHSTRPTSTAKLVRLADDLEKVAPLFGKRGDQRRQASARIILADVYLWLGKTDQANGQMSQALVLIGTLYKNKELVQLSTEVNGIDIVDETYQGSPDTSAQEAARDLARGITPR